MMVDEVYPIPAGEWHFVPIDLKQRPATVTASFDAASGADRIRLALVRPGVTTLAPGRRLAVIAISFAAFLAIAFFAGRKLLAAFAARGAWHS